MDLNAAIYDKTFFFSKSKHISQHCTRDSVFIRQLYVSLYAKFEPSE